MKVHDTRTANTVTFRSLQPGDGFIFSGTLYIKTVLGSNDYYGTALCNGALHSVAPTTAVTPVEIEAIIK